MEIIGAILVVFGAGIGFGAKKIVQGKQRFNGNEQDEREFLELIEKGTIYVKTAGFVIVIIGFLFIFL